ncbi:MAG TPA: hypothetical protein QF499_09590 [Gammaproteobacteria bacterium]|nr:hypothetical protein [Gammaproteobacteria bacterium]MDP7661158.1 hypothetical protein [Gammaproteobacteria bacterium]HJP39364.1 hypothetical protein [Gammaproteobacteria bacterium]
MSEQDTSVSLTLDDAIQAVPVIPESCQPSHRTVSVSPRHHRQRGPESGQSPAADISNHHAGGRIRDRVHRQVAHGQRSDAAARV